MVPNNNYLHIILLSLSLSISDSIELQTLHLIFLSLKNLFSTILVNYNS